ncbi:MAG TPA: DUF1846 domain-containing protein [Clostridiaceae bacterium]|nr:DUF1846 domain-containing protein [Clostridiaceae bacterium]
MSISFDYEKYLKEQSEYILERISKFNNKLYLEFGGKLFYDFHASRVLPGFDPNAKVKLLNKLKDKLEIIICVYAGDIERNKVRADFDITYDMDVLRLIDDLREWDLAVNSVVITRYAEQPAATIFRKKLERRGIKTYTHGVTSGYPTDVDVAVSDKGYGKNAYIETAKPLVIVTGPGPASGKLSTCLSQLYHEYKRGVKAGYAKFETFPIWNLPLKHPVNFAYEAATADVKDVNMIDPFHLDAYGITAVNYNRDIEVFPILKRILEKITGEKSIYRSPTDMGVNRIGFCIGNDDAVKEASCQEIIRRFFNTQCEYKKGLVDLDTAQRVELIMESLGLKPEDRKVVAHARKAAEQARKKHGNSDNGTGSAIMLKDGTVVTGKGSNLMNSLSSMLLNAIKTLGNISDEIHLLSPNILELIINLKRDSLGDRNPILNLREILIALSISAATNPTAQLALEKLPNLSNCEAHSTHIVSHADTIILKKLGINMTCDPEFPSKEMFFV